MAGGGVGTRNLVLSSTMPIDTLALAATLQRFGVTNIGAQAFAQGQPVASAADRKALASMFGDALGQLGTR